VEGSLGYEGRIATTNARTTQDLGLLYAKAASLHLIFMLLPMLRGPGRDRHGRILRSLAEMADAGKLHPLIDDSHFTLETAPDAHRRFAPSSRLIKLQGGRAGSQNALFPPRRVRA
jgi:NADPH:quinone reductase-like Zn-dependent oxidoreductase